MTSSADWCTAEISKQYNTTKAVGQNGVKAALPLSTYYLVLTMTENPGYDDRTASITVQDKNSSTKATYKLIQKKQQPPYVTVSNALMKFLASEATEYNELGTNVDASQIEVSSSSSWATCAIDGIVDISTGKAKLKCHVNANTSATTRTATITVKVKFCLSAKATFTISQKGIFDSYEMVLVEGDTFTMGQLRSRAMTLLTTRNRRTASLFPASISARPR